MSKSVNLHSIYFVDGINSTSYYNFCFVNEMQKLNSHFKFITSRFIYDPEVNPPKNTIYFFFHITTYFSAKIKISPRIRRFLRGLEYPFDLIRLFLIIQIHKVKIIHFNYFILPFIENIFLILCKIIGCKIVITAHNSLPHDSGMKYKKIYMKIYSKADLIVTLTSYISDQLRNILGLGNNIRIIPHGDMNFIFDQIKNKNAVKYNKPVIVLLGVISPYKGLMFLIDVLELVLQKIDINLLVIGNPAESLDKYFQHAIKCNVMNNIIWDIGYSNLNQMYNKVINTDIFVFPYAEASQSGGIPTAFTLGIPVIIRPAGGLVEMISENQDGLIAASHKEMAEKIIFLLNNKQKYNEIKTYINSERKYKNDWVNISPLFLKCYSSLQGLRE